MSKPSTLPAGHIYLGAYLLERLAQLDCRVIFGVPGDFNLTFLDLVEDHGSVEWVSPKEKVAWD
jgi:TPP-dependent 2-oxoacid decarboxylase